MKLQLAPITGRNAFTAYGADYVSINSIRHTGNLLVLPDSLIPQWTEATVETLSIQDFEFLVALDADIVILGTGSQLRFPHPQLLQPFMRAGKGLEVMDVKAACRTYNILLSEGRKVAAGLIFS